MFVLGSNKLTSFPIIHLAVSGITCISPMAPALDFAFGLNPLSVLMIANTRLGVRWNSFEHSKTSFSNVFGWKTGTKRKKGRVEQIIIKKIKKKIITFFTLYYTFLISFFAQNKLFYIKCELCVDKHYFMIYNNVK